MNVVSTTPRVVAFVHSGVGQTALQSNIPFGFSITLKYMMNGSDIHIDTEKHVKNNSYECIRIYFTNLTMQLLLLLFLCTLRKAIGHIYMYYEYRHCLKFVRFFN